MTRVVVAMTGASGAAIELRVLELLGRLPDIETHLVLSAAAERTLAHEAGSGAADRARMLAQVVHAVGDIGASIASGSFASAGMLVVPCSMHSLGAIAAGIAHNLIVRAADVHLKERRRLVLMARETPLHLGHLRNMVAVTEMGAIVMPPMPAFYNLPQCVEDIVDQLAARAIDLLDLPGERLAREWRG